MTAPHISLADFAATWGGADHPLPAWVLPSASLPQAIAHLDVRNRIEDVLDTIVAMQRADRLEDGVYVGPRAMSEVYRDVLECSRTLQIAVPSAIISGIAMRSQGTFGTDSRAFLYLSSFFFKGTATEEERRFLAGRLCGHIAARQVTASTLYALIADQGGLRQVARRSLGPAFEIVLAPLSLGVRLALSRWHRAAELSADRAGLLCARSVDGAGLALLRCSLGVQPTVEPADYLAQLRKQRHESSPGRWTQLVSDTPWTHKRIRALELFRQSALWSELTGEDVEDPLSTEELDKRTDTLLGVS